MVYSCVQCVFLMKYYYYIFFFFVMKVDEKLKVGSKNRF